MVSTSDEDKKMYWDNMSFRLYDPVDPSTTHNLMAGFEYLNKQTSRIIPIIIDVFDKVGISVERWEITGRIFSVNFGLLEYETTGPCYIHLTFTPETVKLIK
jgi:hypothetical protein